MILNEVRHCARSHALCLEHLPCPSSICDHSSDDSIDIKLLTHTACGLIYPPCLLLCLLRYLTLSLILSLDISCSLSLSSSPSLSLSPSTMSLQGATHLDIAVVQCFSCNVNRGEFVHLPSGAALSLCISLSVLSPATHNMNVTTSTETPQQQAKTLGHAKTTT